MNFQPQHFPVGTTFEVNDDVAKFHKDDDGNYISVFTATGVHRNGPNSYVVQTTVLRTIGKSSMFVSFHTDNIKRIVKRGAGPMNIEYMQYSAAEIIYKDFIREQTGLSKFAFKTEQAAQVLGSARTHYLFLGADTLMVQLVHRFLQPNHFVFDEQAAARSLMQQSFVHTVLLGKHLHVHCAPKKRLNRWLKQNVNRFLVNVKQKQAENDQEDYRRYCQDLDREEDERPKTRFDLMWERGEKAFADNISMEDLENTLSDEHDAGTLSSEDAENIRYGYDSARTIAQRKASVGEGSCYDSDEQRPVDYSFLDDEAKTETPEAAADNQVTG